MTSNFSELGLGSELVQTLAKKGYEKPTPIQEQAIPEILRGSDILASAQTGTGKTAGFALPLLQLISEARQERLGIRALILTPTRELAEQISRNIRTYSRNLRIASTVVVGGMSIHQQRKELSRLPEIVVATPGRLADVLQRGYLDLSDFGFVVLDEADRMLDMGFIHEVKRIIAKTPDERQTLLFSATLSGKIAELSRSILRSPKRIEIAPESTVAENLSQSVFFVEQGEKASLLVDTLKDIGSERVVVFTRTKHRANRLAQQLSRSGIAADAIHSNKSQSARRRTLSSFDRGQIKVLVGTDVVARGIDVKDISHVINFELPDDPENYVHRIGRTARAESSGAAYSFCSAEEVSLLHSIERMTRQRLLVESEQAYHSDRIGELYKSPPRRGGGGSGGRRSFRDGPKRSFRRGGRNNGGGGGSPRRHQRRAAR